MPLMCYIKLFDSTRFAQNRKRQKDGVTRVQLVKVPLAQWRSKKFTGPGREKAFKPGI